MYDIYTLDRFLESIETLELCREHILAPSKVRTRIALILLDNQAEILMYHKCQDLFEHDKFLRNVLAPTFSAKERSKTEDYFEEKVSLLTKKARFIRPHDATILKISHDYRNRAFHQDTHNPSATQAMVRVLFKTVCNIFAQAYGSSEVSISYDLKQYPQLAKYGVPNSVFEYSKAPRIVATHLIKGIGPELKKVGPVLLTDLERRWKKLIESVLTEIPLAEIVLDEILKSEEFDETFDYETASKEYRELTYTITSKRKPSFKPSEDFKKKYWALEHEYTIRVRKAYDAFKPSLTWRNCLNIQTRISRLRQIGSTDEMLLRYNQIDEALSKAERLLYAAIRKNEEAQDMQDEIARGK